MNYNDSLPTLPTTITGLVKARNTLSPYLLDVANAISTGEVPPRPLWTITSQQSPRQWSTSRLQSNY